jgi:drug/metabolite transporter (DMT)-like permease
MIFSAKLLGIFFALSSAVVWGSGDFSGGYASRRCSQYQVLALSALSGLVLLIVAAIITQEVFPSTQSIWFAVFAGLSGALGISALYRALAIGPAALVAPTAAVIGASLPVVYSGFFEGWPVPTTLLGFGLALTGIWILSSASDTLEQTLSRRGFILASLAGAGFAGFFTLLGQVEPGKYFTPLIIARASTLTTGLILIRIHRLPLPALTSNLPALLAGILDASGNLFYILAKQYVRLDTAVVLASLYPASTVLLSSLIFKENVTRRHWLGLFVCLLAVALISL